MLSSWPSSSRDDGVPLVPHSAGFGERHATRLQALDVAAEGLASVRDSHDRPRDLGSPSRQVEPRNAQAGSLFYVVAPPYTRTSAGVRCLHRLCHSLNLQGETAYLVLDPLAAKKGMRHAAAPNLLTPFLTDEIAQDHFNEGRTPIVVYSESVVGNPYDAACVVRFVAHFPGFLGGDERFGENELCFGFSQKLATAAGVPDNVLFIPSVDTEAYRPPAPGTVRRGSCFYADKYRKVHAGVPFAVTANSVEIKRQEPGEQSQAEIIALLQTSELFYTYENTALAIEAVLCGCPVVFLPNPWLTEIISDSELGREGYAWGADPQQIAWAKSTVGQAARKYHDRVEQFRLELERFTAKATDHAERFASNEPILASRYAKSFSVPLSLLLRLAKALPLGLAREIAKFASTCGFRRVGHLLWDDWLDRFRCASERSATQKLHTKRHAQIE